MSAAVAASIASGGVESLGFLNDIVAQLWDNINIAVAKMVKEVVEPMFADMLPGPLKSLHFVKIDLGKNPIRFDNIDVHRRSEGIIKVNLDVDWNGECDIDLKASVIGTFGVEKVKLKGRVSVLLCPIVDRLPLVTAMQVGFINPPELSLDFTGAADIADLSIIDSTIRKVIQKVLAMILVLPNRLLVKIDPTNDYFATYQQPLGFLRLTVVSASGFKVPKGFLKDIPDAYCIVKMGALPSWKTSTKDNDTAPRWNESTDFLLSDQDQLITIDVWDDDLARDDAIGKGAITVSKLLLDGKAADVPLFVKGEDTGAKVSIKCEIYEFVPDVTSFESDVHQGEDLKCGVITILVAGAKDIPGPREDAATYVHVEWGDEEFKTPVMMNNPGIDALNPPFDCSFRILLTSEMAASPSDFTLSLYCRKQKIGSVEIAFADVLQAPDRTVKDTFDLSAGGPAITASINVSGITLAN